MVKRCAIFPNCSMACPTLVASRCPLSSMKNMYSFLVSGAGKDSDPREVQILFFENGHCIGQGTWFVADLKQDGSFVVTTWCRFMLSEDSETCPRYCGCLQCFQQSRPVCIRGRLPGLPLPPRHAVRQPVSLLLQYC